MSRVAWAMVSSAFLMNVGSFAVFTYLVVYLSQQVGLASWQVGTVLAANILCQRVLAVVTGALADGIGYRTALLCGFLLRGLGFLGYEVFHGFVLLVISACLIGCGAALYSPTMSAIFAAQGDKKVFTYYNQALNAGFIVGPLLGSVMMSWGAQWLFVWGAAVYCGMAVMAWFIPVKNDLVANESSIVRGYRDVWKDKKFLRFASWLILYWVVWQQFMVSLPLEASRIADSAFVGRLFALSGLFGLVAMFALRKQFEKRQAISLVRVGTLLVSLGLMAIPIWMNPWWLVICVAVFMIGETLVLPASDVAISEYADGGAAATYFGFGDMSNGLGAAIGSYLGAFLLKVGSTSAWPWMVYGAIGLVAVLGMSPDAMFASKSRVVDG